MQRGKNAIMKKSSNRIYKLSELAVLTFSAELLTHTWRGLLSSLQSAWNHNDTAGIYVGWRRATICTTSSKIELEQRALYSSKRRLDVYGKP